MTKYEFSRRVLIASSVTFAATGFTIGYECRDALQVLSDNDVREVAAVLAPHPDWRKIGYFVYAISLLAITHHWIAFLTLTPWDRHHREQPPPPGWEHPPASLPPFPSPDSTLDTKEVDR